MKFVFLALLLVTTVIHLYHSWTNEKSKRKYSKPFLLILILLYYIFSTDKYSAYLIAALATSWLGDVLLIPSGNKWFFTGGISFFVAHILFINVYSENVDFAKVNWFVIIPVAIVYCLVAAFIIKAVKDSTPKMMLAPLYLYLIANSIMNIFALMQLFTNPCAGSVIAYVGAVSFFASDCSLFLVRYHKNKDLVFKKHFTVMLTYILGEFLITQGILMLK